jgi:hypothetical protein
MPRFATPDSDDNNSFPRPAQDEVRANNNSSKIPVRTLDSSVETQMNPATGLAQTEIDVMIAKNQIAKQNDHWAKTYWRPAMGWLYMAICAFDFIIFPLLSIILPIFRNVIGVDFPYTTWQPLTLSSGGLIHMAFGAILGVAAWTRGQEKIAGKA